MAKKKSWGINLDAAKSAAKDSIRETEHATPKKKPGPKKFIDMEQVVLTQVTKDSRRLLKKIAAYEDVTMLEYISKLIATEAQKRNIK